MARPKKEKPNRADNLYEVKVTIGHTFEGKLIRKSFYSNISLADAKRKGEEYKIEQAVAEQTGKNFISPEMPFRKWAAKWLEVYKKPNVSENTFLLTYKNCVDKHIIPYFGDAPLSRIKPVDIQKFFSTKLDLSESMLQKINMCLNSIFETAIDNDIVVKNPVKNVKFVSNKQKNKKNVYSSEEIVSAKTYFIDVLPEVFIILSAGLRRGEMLGLKWSDIDFKRESLSVSRSIADKKGGGIEVRPPKWNSYRDIPIYSETISLLKKLKENNDTGYVFGINADTPQSPNTWSQKLDRHMKLFREKTGAIELTAHELRHTYGTELRRNGVDIYTIQKIMGHKDIRMTSEIYVHNEFDTLKKSLEPSE